jgi:hypothetical protein
MLANDMEAPGRVWLLLQHLDTQARGWLWVDDVREKLTNKQSPTRVCGWRRLRQILSQGENVFWTRDRSGRIWIRGSARVAMALYVDRLVGKPVELPLPALLGGIGDVRAHFYASFHSGRRDSNPITRQKLRELTGVPERSQHDYERQAGVDSQRNMTIGERYSVKEVQERAWRHGRAAFHFVDIQGKQGKPGREYIAWHMPNSYQGPHDPCCKGRQKKINRQLRETIERPRYERDAGERSREG